MAQKHSKSTTNSKKYSLEKILVIHIHNTCICFNVYSLSQVVSDKLLNIRDTAWGTVECQLVSSTKFRDSKIIKERNTSSRLHFAMSPKLMIHLQIHHQIPQSLKLICWQNF